MKVQVNEGQGPIAGRYGVKNDGEIFNVPAGDGKALEKSGKVRILDDSDSDEDEPAKGLDMKMNNQLRKEDKRAAKLQTKEEKHSGKTKDTETEPTEPAPAA